MGLKFSMLDEKYFFSCNTFHYLPKDDCILTVGSLKRPHFENSAVNSRTNKKVAVHLLVNVGHIQIVTDPWPFIIVIVIIIIVNSNFLEIC